MGNGIVTDERPMVRLILASGSPRRRALLAEAGYQFDVVVPAAHVEAECPPGATLEETVVRLARAKAHAVARQVPRGLVLAADTLVECRGSVLGKPVDRQDAERILRHLSGQPHRVLTGVVVRHIDSGREVDHVEVSTLRMAPLSDSQIEEYLHSGKWQGKAGAFGYQDGWDWLVLESGSASNVVGLPVERLPELFSRLQVSVAATRAINVDAPSRPETDRRSPKL